MPDLTVAPYRKGHVEITKGFDVGAGPSRDIEEAILSLEDLVEEDGLDEALVRRVAWMQDWEDLVALSEPREGWTLEEAGDTTTAVCAPKELERILAAMETLRPQIRKELVASWDELTAFLRACAKNGGTVCLWYDPMG
jgi:hypothetical protein